MTLNRHAADLVLLRDYVRIFFSLRGSMFAKTVFFHVQTLVSGVGDDNVGLIIDRHW